MKKKKKKKLGLRIVSWILIVFFSLIILVTVFLRWFFPNEQVRQLLESQLASSLNQPVSIESVRLNPFGSIDFQRIKIGEPVNIKQGDMYVHISQISVWYHILPLLKKHVAISGIKIDQPTVILAPPFQFKAAASIQENTHEFADSVEAASPFPISLNLHAIHINQIDFTFYMPDSAISDYLHAKGISLKVDRLEIPQNFLTHPQDIRGSVEIKTRLGHFQMRSSNQEWLLKPDIYIKLNRPNQNSWELESQIKIFSALKNYFYLSSDISVQGKGFTESLHIQDLNIGLNGAHFIQLNGDVHDFIDNPRFHVQIESDAVQLQSIYDAVQTFMPDAFVSLIPDVHLNGAIQCATGFIQGDANQATFDYQLTLENGDFLLMDPIMKTEDLNFNLRSRGQIQSLKKITGSLSSESRAASLQMDFNDSLRFKLDGLFWILESQIDTVMWPKKILLHGGIQQILNGSLSWHFDFNRMDNKPEMEFPYQIKGQLLSDSLALNQIPFLDNGFDGTLSTVMNLDSKSLQQTQLYLSAASNGLIYPFGASQDTTPPLTLSSVFHVQGDEDFQKWTLDSCQLQLNDLLKMNMTGSFTPQIFKGKIPNLMINNDMIIDFLPHDIKVQLKDLKLSGIELINAEGIGQLIDDSLHLNFNANLMLNQAGIAWPSMGLYIKESNGQIGIKGSPFSMKGESRLMLNEIYFAPWRQNPLSQFTVNLNYLIESPSRIFVYDGALSCEELGLNGLFDFGINDLDASPDMQGNVSLKIENYDSVEVMEALYTTGKFESSFQLSTLNAEKQHLRLSGNVGFENLYLNQSMVQVKGINGFFPMQIDYDLTAQRFITPKNRMVYSWLDYELNRNFYKNRFPNLKTLRINSIETQGLQFEQLVLDIDMSHGLVQIPFFNVLLFDGNLGGSFKLDYGSSHLDSMNYSMKAQAAQINSAVFGQTNAKVEETSELNATMSFEGQGLNFASEFDVNGYFYITKIGPRFASTLLTQMNPDGKDRSMTMTRRLLDTGWKPKRFSFDVRHSFVYPSLSLSQPWFSPVKIPGELQYGRLPIQLFLQIQTN